MGKMTLSVAIMSSFPANPDELFQCEMWNKFKVQQGLLQTQLYIFRLNSSLLVGNEARRGIFLKEAKRQTRQGAREKNVGRNVVTNDLLWEIKSKNDEIRQSTKKHRDSVRRIEDEDWLRDKEKKETRWKDVLLRPRGIVCKHSVFLQEIKRIRVWRGCYWSTEHMQRQMHAHSLSWMSWAAVEDRPPPQKRDLTWQCGHDQTGMVGKEGGFLEVSEASFCSLRQTPFAFVHFGRSIWSCSISFDGTNYASSTCYVRALSCPPLSFLFSALEMVEWIKNNVPQCQEGLCWNTSGIGLANIPSH